MSFPRTQIDGISVPRMLIGTNWFLGFSHTSPAHDALIHNTNKTYKEVAAILDVFLEHDIDACVGFVQNEKLHAAIQEAQQRSGKKMTIISTPSIHTECTPEADDENKKLFDKEAELGATICMPHTCSTDTLLDRISRTIRYGETFCKMIRERGMVPGLSTHLNESIIYADETNLDVGTYIQIYNAQGFLMPLEIDWTNHIISNAKKPVITIKPMAAGRIPPFVGLAFAWATLRPKDMVTVGTMTPDEAKECIELSYKFLEGREGGINLQPTRSKASVMPVDSGTSEQRRS
jgi:hypothetical protein